MDLAIDTGGASPDLPWFERECECIVKNQSSVSEIKKQGVKLRNLVCCSFLSI